jgi:aromatic-L-amino-acid decarboxylase
MSLDPTDWAVVRAVGRRMVGDMLDYQETVRERPPWRPVPAEGQGAVGRARTVRGRGAGGGL